MQLSVKFYRATVAMLIALAPLVGAKDKTSAAGTTNFPAPISKADPTDLVSAGHELFLLNCAHCHAADASGDEGPDLHGVKKSDARMAAIIKNGVKGEMPKFGAKLTEANVQALVAFIRSLK